MKIRFGFVSNSSSSSYVIRLKNMSFNDFVDYVMAGDLGYFEDAVIEERINESIESWERVRQEPNRFLPDYMDIKLELYREYLERFNHLQSNEERVRLVLNLHEIRMGEEGNDLLLHYYTIMHNSFNEGMNDLYKELIFYFLFDLKKEMYCDRIDDSM